MRIDDIFKGYNQPTIDEIKKFVADAGCVIVPREPRDRFVKFLREIVAIDPKSGGGQSMYFVTGEIIAEARALLDEIDGLSEH